MVWSPQKIKQLRQAYGETQDVFRARLGVSLDTIRCWEQGKGEPIGPAQLLLERLKEDLDQGSVRPLELATA